nr:AAA family ATPase [Bradyrhizobium sp. G127]
MDLQTLANDRRQRLKGLKYPFQLISDFTIKPPRKYWIVKGVIAQGETSAWIAPPGGMKSALMAQLALATAWQLDWHGHRSTACRAVIYFALERADLVRRRLAAHCAKQGITGETLAEIPLAVCDRMVDLTHPDSVKHVLDTIDAAFEEIGQPVQLIIFDTFAKLIAAGGGDEQQAKDQGKIFANIQRIKEKVKEAHVALVGHTGKDESRGARGSNAILGDVDVMVQISGDAVKTATVIKANDMPEGPLFSFTSEIHHFGVDEDGDPITVNIVSADTPEATKAAERGPRLTKNQQTMFAILHDAGAGGLTLDEWNAAAREAGLGERRKADLTDNRNALKTKGLVRSYGDRWTVDHR